MDTHGIAALDITRNIVAAIDIVDITSGYQQSGRITFRERIERAVRRRSRQPWHAPLIRVHIRHAATPIDIVDDHILAVDNQQDTLWMRHGPGIATAIKVSDQSPLQVPCRTDGHRSLVIAAKETANLELITAGR